MSACIYRHFWHKGTLCMTKIWISTYTLREGKKETRTKYQFLSPAFRDFLKNIILLITSFCVKTYIECPLIILIVHVFHMLKRCIHWQTHTDTHTYKHRQTQTLHFKLQISIEASSRRLPHHCSILRDENSHDLEHMTSITFLQDKNFRLIECILLEIYDDDF